MRFFCRFQDVERVRPTDRQHGMAVAYTALACSA